jgi:hypothetical protein
LNFEKVFDFLINLNSNHKSNFSMNQDLIPSIINVTKTTL